MRKCSLIRSVCPRKESFSRGRVCAELFTKGSQQITVTERGLKSFAGCSDCKVCVLGPRFSLDVEVDL